MSVHVDVLAVMDDEIRSLPEIASVIRFSGANHGWGIDESEAVRRLETARAAVAELIEAVDAERKGEYQPEHELRSEYQYRRRGERSRVDAALARVRGAA